MARFADVYWPPHNFKNDCIWVVMLWSSTADNSIPHYILKSKFESFLSSSPHRIRWEICLPSMIPGHAANPGGDARGPIMTRICHCDQELEGHKTLVADLIGKKKKDRFAFSDFYVVDSRKCVIGDDFPKYWPSPVITMDEIMIGSPPFHADIYGNNDSDGIASITGSIEVAKFSLPGSSSGGTDHLMIRCRDDGWEARGDYNVRDWSNGYLYYTRMELSVYEDKTLESNLIPFSTKMRLVHQLNKKWLDNTSTIPRPVLPLLRTTYKSDPTLSEGFRQVLQRSLDDKYSRSEWERYRIGKKPSTSWLRMDFHDRMAFVHNKHREWLDDTEAMDHVQHACWSKIYEGDGVMSDSVKASMMHEINKKLNATIYKIKMSTEVDYRRHTPYESACFSYWANQGDK